MSLVTGYTSLNHCVCQSPHLHNEDAKVCTSRGFVGMKRDGYMQRADRIIGHRVNGSCPHSYHMHGW